MIYTDNFCCCVDLKCGCVIIAIVDVIMRGVDKFLLDRDSVLGYASLVISAVYLITCVILLIGAILAIRILLMPYMCVALLHVLVLVWECVYVITIDDFYDYIIFDIIQAFFGLYFCLVVYSYYDSI